ncbi:MAG: helix-turn-helix domain-containing protein [Prevotellaceae bacterium]|jgi:transcriptional regulator with XRE-family HTH domain|nr:helix-turn-helix domain-containing protein [Prevotellaceae bacterium]
MKILLLMEFYLLLLKNKEYMEKTKIENVIRNISLARTKKGYTYENMAAELSLTPASYRKIEVGETKLTVERLFQISEILNVSLSDLLEIDNAVFQQTNSANATGYLQQVANFYQENKEIYEKLLQSKDKQIELPGQTHVKLLLTNFKY